METVVTSCKHDDLPGASRHHGPTREPQVAYIRKTRYGAVIELAGGQIISLWTFALDEPVMDAALRRARLEGASHIVIDNPCAT